MIYDLIILANSKNHAKVLQEDYDEADLGIKVKCVSKNVSNSIDGLEGKFVVLAPNVFLTQKDYEVVHHFSRKMEKKRYSN